MIVCSNNLHAARICEAAEVVHNPFADQVIARVEGDTLYGGVVFQNYTGRGGSIQMHMAGFVRNWANREMIWAAFDYPFTQLGCKKVFGPVRASATETLEIDRRLGFKVEAVVEDVFPDEACVILALAREDCRWLKLKPRTLQRGKEA